MTKSGLLNGETLNCKIKKTKVNSLLKKSKARIDAAMFKYLSYTKVNYKKDQTIENWLHANTK